MCRARGSGLAWMVCAALSLLLGGLATSLHAEDGPFECRGAALAPEAARSILTEVQRAYSGVSTLEARFVQDSYLAALDVAERSSGTMVFERPGRMRWEYAAPESQTFVVRDGSVWFHQPRERQMLIDEFRDILISDIPVAFLMGLGKLGEDFTVERACASGDSVVLDLRPRAGEQGEQLKGFTLVVDRERLPLGAKVTDVGGNTTAIQLAGRTSNHKIPEASFHVEVPPGTDVNDQRVKKGA